MIHRSARIGNTHDMVEREPRFPTSTNSIIGLSAMISVSGEGSWDSNPFEDEEEGGFNHHAIIPSAVPLHRVKNYFNVD